MVDKPQSRSRLGSSPPDATLLDGLAKNQERVALELHDTVIQRLFAAGLDLHGSIARARSPELAARLTGTVEDLQSVISEIRTTIFDLQSSVNSGNDFRTFATASRT